MTHNASKDELIASIGGLVSHAQTVGFPQTREILIVALTILSQEIRQPTKPVQVAGKRAAYANLDHEPDWHAKEEIYLQALIEAQD